jgi:zinc transport system ATP-binding protein
MAQGFIHRIESLNAYVGCDHPGETAHGPFLLCKSCGQAFELMDDHLDAAVEEGASRMGFTVSDRTVELSGLCPRCHPVGLFGGVAMEAPPLAATGGEETPGDSLTPSTMSSTAETLPRLLVEVDGVAVDFAGNEVLDEVSLAVREGEIVTLIGPNGAGKTTLVRVILGLLRPSRGSVFRAPGLRLGYMPQRLDLDHTLPLPVTNFLTLGGQASRDAIWQILDEVGAPHLLDRPMSGLSGGELRRVLLARALLRNPDLLVLDEPVQGVDVVGQADLYRLISQMRKSHGCGVLMVSHDLHVVMSATDRVVCLNNHVCCSGHPKAVSRHPEYLALFGPQAAGDMAVYTHHHDHSHDMHGDVLPSQSKNKDENSAGDGVHHDHG